MKIIKSLAIIAIISIVASGCTSVDHRSNLHSVKEQDLTVGKVQKKLKLE